jgi:putative DNA primase/helicase
MTSTGPIGRILAALSDHGHEPRKSGAGWNCRCPAHDDRNPSLSIHAGDDGRVLMHCHAGCTIDAVCGAIGLRASDLFERDPGWLGERNGKAPRTRPSVTVTRTPRKAARNEGFGDGDAKTFASASDAVAELERRHGPKSACWVYHDMHNHEVGLVIRWNTPTGKEVRPVSRKADGSGWIIGGMPTTGEGRPLYALPDLMATPAGSRVYVTEGEKAADAARAIGLVATTSPHGSKSAAKADWSPLAGRDVIIFPDRDDAGERYANDVTKLAKAAGASSVRVVRLVDIWAEMPKGGDMADLLDDQGGDVDAIRTQVEALVEGAEPTSTDASSILLATPKFDLDALFPMNAAFARDYLAAVSQSTQTPIEMPALLALAIASAAVCNVALVRGHGDYKEPAQLWGLVLCEPAVRKSAVLSELLAPIVAWEKRQALELAPEIAAAIQRRKIDEKRLKSIEDHVARSKDPQQVASLTAEAVALAQAIQATPIPTPPVLLASEPTPEALCRQMVHNYGRALLASAEADALDIVQGRYSGSRNYGILLKGHAGDAVRAQRVGRPGDTIDHPALAVALCVQPQAVRELWADPHAEGRGLLARFAVILPRDRVGFRDVRPPRVPDLVRATWQAGIDRLLSFEPHDSPVVVRLSTESDALYHEFQKRTEAALGAGDLAERRAWGGKLCGLTLRIALTLHALQNWAHVGKPEDFPEIDAATMQSAIAWADYLAAAERYARELLRETDEERETRLLVDWIEHRGGRVTVRDLTHGMRAYRGNPKGAEQALMALVEAGRGCWETDDHGSKGGRPVQRFRLITTVTVTETSANTKKDMGSGDGDTGHTPLSAQDGWGET